MPTNVSRIVKLSASISDSQPLKLYFFIQHSEVIKNKIVKKNKELYDLIIEVSDYEFSSESEFDGED